MKTNQFLLLILLVISGNILLAQNGWIDKGSFKEMPYPVDNPVLMDKSPDGKFLYIISTNKERTKTYYSVADFETGEVQSNFDIPQKDYRIISEDGKTIYYCDSLRFGAFEPFTGREVFNIKLQSKKELIDSINCISKIRHLFSWKDKQRFFVPIECEFQRSENYDWGLTGNYYIIDKSGNIEYSSELIGSINNFIPGKDKESYIITFSFEESRKPNFYNISQSEMRMYSNEGYSVLEFSQLSDFSPELNAFVTVSELGLNIYDAKTRLKIRDLKLQFSFLDFCFISGGRYIAFAYSSNWSKKSFILTIIDVNTGVIALQLTLPALISKETILFNFGNSLILNGSNKLIKVEPKFLNSDFMAYFSTENKHIIEGNDAKFYNFSPGNPDSVKWDFGDGETSADWSTGHIFSKPGVYDITLTAFKGNIRDSFKIKECIIVHKKLIPEFSVEPQSGVPPFDVKIERISKEGNFVFYMGNKIIVNDIKTSNESSFTYRIDNPGNLYIWLDESDSVFTFSSHKLVESEYQKIISPIFTTNKIFSEEYISSNIETVMEGNNNNIVFKTKYREYDKQSLALIKQYSRIQSIGKNFEGQKTIMEFNEDIDIVKLENRDYLVIFKKEGNSTLEIDENGSEISKDKFLPGVNRRILSIKQGLDGLVYIENSGNEKYYITAMNSYGIKMWEIETSRLISYLPLKSGGIAIGFDRSVIFDYYKFPLGFIEFYTKAGVLTRKIDLESYFYYYNSGFCYKSPVLLFQKNNDEIIFIKSTDGTTSPKPDKLVSTDNKELYSNITGRIFMIDENHWLNQNKGYYIYNTFDKSSIYDTLNNSYSLGTSFSDGEYLYLGGNIFNSYMPGKGYLLSTNSCLLKTRLITDITGIEEDNPEKSSQFNAFFDFSGDNIIIEILDDEQSIYQIDIYDMMGRCVIKSGLDASNHEGNELKIYAPGLPAGVYFIGCSNSKGLKTGKLIKPF